MHKKRTISQRSELVYDLHNFGINVDTRELFLHPNYDVDNDEAEIDYRVANALIKNICFLDSQNDEPITIHMCSCGGSWEDGLAIYDVIQASSSFISIIAYAQASSMASVILQAGDRRVLTPNTYVMIHSGSDGWEGTSQGLITHAKQAEYATEQMLDIYVARCKDGVNFKEKTEKQVRNYLIKQMRQKQEWYLPAKQAIEYGFADFISDDPKIPTL